MTRTDRTDRRILALVLVTVVIALCAGELAHAMPRDVAAMDCGARLCAGSTGCSATTPPRIQAVAVVPLPEVPSLAGPGARAIGVRAAASRAAPDRFVHAFAPRSPPLV